MKVSPQLIARRIRETISGFEKNGETDSFWLMSGAIAAKLEECGQCNLATLIMDRGRNFDAEGCAYLLEIALEAVETLEALNP